MTVQHTRLTMLGRLTTLRLLAAAFLHLSATSALQAVPDLTGLRRSKLAPAPAQDSAGAARDVVELRAKLEEAQANANRVQGDASSLTNLPPGATVTEAIEYRSALQLIVKTQQTHLDNFTAIQDIRGRREDFENSTRAWIGFDDPPPYSVLFVDSLRDTAETLSDKIALGKTGLEFLDTLTVNLETALKGHQGDLRRIQEQLETEKEPGRIVRLTWLRELSQTRSRLTAATLASFETLRLKTNEEQSEYRLRLAFAQRQLALASQQISFPKEDLDHLLALLDAEYQKLEQEAQAANATLDASRKTLAEARDALQQALRAPIQQTNATATIRRLQSLVELRDVQSQTDSEAIVGLRQLLDGVTLDRQLWQLRYAVFDTRHVAEFQEATRRLRKLSELAETARQYFAQKAAVTANQVIEQQNSLDSANDSPADKQIKQEQLASLQKRASHYRRVLESAAKRARLVQRWQESFDWNRKHLPLLERGRFLFTETSGFAAKLWHFELFVAEETITVDGQTITGRRGVTVGKIMQVLLLLVIGYWCSSRVARAVQRLTARRLGIETNQANLIRRWVFITLMSIVVIVSMVLAKIPLTVFTFAGGALAIGFGFGMQNLIKNFISGIIILFERPFRVGDMLDINGQRGTVTSIGIRSSVVLFVDGTETLIPNSSLLENNLTNCTFSNRNVRFSLAVGVAYGTDTSLVARLLSEVAERHGLVLKEPAPQVLFTNFSDSTLNFEVRFWVDVSKHNSAQVSSDLRHMIAKTFAEHGVCMAFPQRDIHWDTKPLQVQLTRADAAGASAKD